MAHGRIRSPEDLGRAIRHVRRVAGLTQRDLADQLQVTQRWLSEIETGKPKILDARLFAVIAMLGITLEWQSDD